MKRRTFIATVSLVAVGLPFAYYFKKNKSKAELLMSPELLARFCDKKTLKEIGIDYRSLNPSENNKQKLTNLILTDVTTGKKIKPNDGFAVEELITKKMHEDFSAQQILVLNGWVISKTEARQCALFSLANS